MDAEPTLEQLRERLRAVKTKAQIRLLEAQLATYDQFVVDPREPFYDDNGFWVPIATEQVPLGQDNRGRGEVLPVYLTDYGLKAIRDLCRRLAQFNEFAINAHSNRVAYTVGEGCSYEAVPVNDGVPPALVDACQEVIDEFIAVNEWGETEQEIVERCDTDGESFLWYFDGADGVPEARFIEPEHVKTPSGYSDDSKHSFGIVTAPHDIKTRLGYWVWDDPEHAPNDYVPADEIQHIKFNTNSAAKRGLPTMFPIRQNLDRAEKLLRNMSVMGQVQASVPLIRKHKGYSKADIQAFTDNEAEVAFSQPTNARTTNLMRFDPGSVIDGDDNTDYEWPGGTVNAPAFVTVLQADLRACASRLVMPEYMLTSDASNANYSSTLVAGSPSVKNFKRIQNRLKHHFGHGRYRIGRAKNQGAMWRAIRGAVRVGRLPRAALRLIKIQCVPPAVEIENRLEEENIRQVRRQNGVLSPQTWSQEAGLDYDVEQRNLEEHAERAGPGPGLGDQGGGNPPVAEQLRRLTESMDGDGVLDQDYPRAVMLDVPHRRQQTGWSCGAAAAAAVLAWFGMDAREEALRPLLGTNPDEGTDPASLQKFFQNQALDTVSRANLTIRDLRQALAAGTPVLCPVQAWGTAEEAAREESGHWVVVCGVDKSHVYAEDPVSGRRGFPQVEFLRRWVDTDAKGRRYLRFGIAVGLRQAQGEVGEAA